MRKLRILLLEDNSLDAELILANLDEGEINADSTQVITRKDYQNALERETFDLILADYSLPSFDGISALKIAQEKCPEVPFLFVSGAMGEEVAIETLKSGATDYVLKQHLDRLVPSVERALREAAERRERQRLEEALRQRAEELAETDRRKDEFLAMLSHELRNPLAPVRNAIQIMRLRSIDDPLILQARDIIDRQVQHMSQLIDDLLDVSRITRGKIQLRKQKVDLNSVINLAVETSRPQIEKRQHRLHLSISNSPLWLEADPVRLGQVLANLLNNAAKYTDLNGEIWLSSAHEGDEAVLRIRDNGLGIAPEMRSRIFDLFMQVDRSLDRSQGGLGIGLTLVRRLVEMHEGTIQVESDGPGQGSEFIVRLPVQTRKFERPTAENETSSRRSPRTTPSQRILVVDDNKDGAESLAMMLRLWGHEVDVTYDGPQALEKVQSFRPHLVLLDIGLPGMDGFEVVARLRQQTGAKCPVLMALTGYGQDEDRRRSREAGFDHHLVKPIDPDELQRVIAAQFSPV